MLAGRSHGLGCTAAGTSGVPDLPSVGQSGAPLCSKDCGHGECSFVAYQFDAFDLQGSESICSEDVANLGGRVFSNAPQALLGR